MNAPLFLANLFATVVALGLTLHAGRAGRRRRHYGLVAVTLVLLALAIVQAELFGRHFRFDVIRLQVHLALAVAALLSLPGVAWSGVGLARGRVRRAVHRRWVSAFVALVAGAVLTALWMFLNSVPLDA